VLKVVVGLGNPGAKYEKTRHNVGFLFLDHLAQKLGATWSMDKRFHGLVSQSVLGGNRIYLLKPQTFMNRSGSSVVVMMQFYKLKVDELLVVHDELDFDVGMVKLKQGGGHAGHNGLRDIIAHLGSNDFSRIRLGIGRPLSGRSVSDYVLSKLDSDTFAVLESKYSEIERLIEGMQKS